MKLALVVLFSALTAGCDNRFNWYDRLSEEPMVSELAGDYKLIKGDPAAVPLVEMGYAEINSSLELKADGTFLATGIPGCCVHGFDERTYPFTGGLYSFSGNWSVLKVQEVYDVRLVILEITERTGRTIGDTELEKERRSPSALDLALVRGAGDPVDVGFQIFNGDFWPLRFQKTRR